MLCRVLRRCSGAVDACGLDVRAYEAGEVYDLPPSLSVQWIACGMAEPVLEPGPSEKAVVFPSEPPRAPSPQANPPRRRSKR
jgi:hypothetical protein